MPIDADSVANVQPAALQKLFGNLVGGSNPQPAPPDGQPAPDSPNSFRAGSTTSPLSASAPEPAPPDAQPDAPAPPGNFFAGAGARPNVPALAPSSNPSPQMGTPDAIAKNLPWMPQYRQAQQAMTTATGQPAPPGSTKAQKLAVLLKDGILGAMAGRAANEEAIVQSGGHRSGGAGIGFVAGLNAPAQAAATQQALQRGGLENTQLGQQVAAYPQNLALSQGKTIADILKSRAEATKDTAQGSQADAETAALPAKTALEEAQTLAARYKEDPGSGSLIDLQSGQPVNGGQMIPVQGKELAGVLNVPIGTQVPIQRAIKAADLLTKGITTTNTAEGVFERNRIAGTNTRLGDNPREISLDTPVGALDNSTGKQVMVTRKDIIGSPGRYAPVSADVSTPVIKQMLKEYGSTKPNTAGGTLIANNTAIAHLGLLSDAIDALGNGNTKLFNSLRQKYNEQTGSTVGATFDTVKQAVSGELAKVTGSLSQGEQEAIKGPLDKSNSPQALKAAVVSAVQIMDGKIGALHQHYVDIMHEEPDSPLISPAAQKVRDRLLGGNQGGGAAPGGGSASAPRAAGGAAPLPSFAQWKKAQQQPRP